MGFPCPLSIPNIDRMRIWRFLIASWCFPIPHSRSSPYFSLNFISGKIAVTMTMTGSSTTRNIPNFFSGQIPI
jgi:hypothetical protein